MTQNTNVLAPAPAAALAADLAAKLAALAAADAEFARLTSQVEKEAAWAARNPRFVAGSGHAPTPADRAAIGGRVDEVVYVVRCAACGADRPVNASDVFHVRFCRPCGKAAAKERGRGKRAEKRLAKLGATAPADLDAALAAKREALEALKARLAGK